MFSKRFEVEKDGELIGEVIYLIKRDDYGDTVLWTYVYMNCIEGMMDPVYHNITMGDPFDLLSEKTINHAEIDLFRFLELYKKGKNLRSIKGFSNN